MAANSQLRSCYESPKYKSRLLRLVIRQPPAQMCLITIFSDVGVRLSATKCLMPPLANLLERLLRSGLASIIKALSCSSNSNMLTTAQIIHARLFIINILPSRTSTACQRFRTRKRGKFFCISSYNQSNPAADFKVGTMRAHPSVL